MTIPNRRADAFDTALAAKQTPTDPAIAGLVAVAGALAAVPQLTTPAFRDGLRARLMAEATSLAAAGTVAVPAAVAPVAVSPLQALTRVLAKPAMQVATGGLAATIAVSGLGVGASRSGPGDALYGLKRAIGGVDAPLPAGAQAKVDEIVSLLEREGAGAAGTVEQTLTELKAELDTLTADLLAQARAGSRAAYDRLRAEVATLTALLQSLRGELPPAAQEELDAAMATLNAARAQLNALPLPGGRPGLPLPTGSPTPGGKPAKEPGTKPSSPPPNTPTTIPPSTPGVPQPTITVPPAPPAPTGPPTVPVAVPTLLP